MLFNRFVAVHFKKAGMVIGGRQTLVGTHLEIPPTIEFDCEHTNEPTPNEASIRLINVAPETQKKLFVEGAKVEVEAGYWPQDGRRETGIIFKGQIREVKTTVEDGIDVVSELLFGDGDDAARVRKTRKNMPKGTTHAEVVDAVLTDMEKDGITRGLITVPDYVEPRPLTIDRPSWRELEDICHQHDLLWSIQDGKLNIYPADKPLKDDAVVLTADTGLLDAPEFTHEGVELRTMLLHYLRPGYTFVLAGSGDKSRAPGKYRIERISFGGSNVGDTFGCSITARPIGSNGKVKRSRDRTKARRK